MSASSTRSCSPTTTPIIFSASTICGRYRACWAVPCRSYCAAETEAKIRSTFSYAFGPAAQESASAGYLPKLVFRRITDEPFTVLGEQVTPIPLVHAHFDVYGFRIGDVAYCTDVSEIPRESMKRLEGLRVLVLERCGPGLTPAISD